MGWVKLDDDFFRNPKARAVGVDGRALHVASMCWCAGQVNDGRFPESDVPVIAALAGVHPDLAEVLFKYGLWETPEPGVVQVHDYLAYNPSREQVIARRDRAEKAGTASATARRTTSPTTSPTASQPLPSSSPDRSSSSSSTVTWEGVPDSVWETMAKKKLRTAPDVKNVQAWCAKVARNDRDELGPRAAELVAMYEISESLLVDVLLAGGSSPVLNSLTRRDLPHAG